jgi:hypothetical protein
MALQPLCAPASFQFPDLFTIGRTPWTSDQLVTGPLPIHRTVQTHTKHIYTPNVHALSGIRTHNYRVRESRDNLCIRPLGYRDRQCITYWYINVYSIVHTAKKNKNKKKSSCRNWYVPVYFLVGCRWLLTLHVHTVDSILFLNTLEINNGSLLGTRFEIKISFGSL